MPLTDEDRKIIFNRLQKSLHKCCPPMVIAKEGEAGLEIMGNKPVPYGYDKKIIPGMYFASVVPRKDMVSFYIFPVYDRADEYAEVAPMAIKCLKGKTCFNFKKPEQVVEKEIDAMLKKGMAAWKKEGYMQ